VVGGSLYGRSDAFLWSEATGRVPLAGLLPLNPDATCVANGIGRGGTIIGTGTGWSSTRAVTWDARAVIAAALTGAAPPAPTDLPIPQFNTFALGVNGLGQVVAEGGSGFGTRPYLYTPGGGVTALPYAPPLSFVPAGINDRGEVIGGNHLWTAEGGLRRLGSLTGGSGVNALAINNHGTVVGHGDGTYGSGYFTSYNAFVWTEDDGAVALDGLTDGLPEGWHLDLASGINDRGQIVGAARGPDNYRRPFLLTPVTVPEPATAALLPLAAAALLPPHRRRSRTRRGSRTTGATDAPRYM
jgi:uncharacterized membrane protein